MKDILNTYTLKELKQFVSKYNKSLGAVRGYSTLKKSELIALMTKAENVGKFKNIKEKGKKAPAPKPAKAPTPKPAKAPTPKPAKAPTPKPAKAPTPKPTPKQVSEIEKRTGKSRAEINKMSPAELVKFLPTELRENIASKMSDGYVDTGIKIKNRRANLYKIEEADGSKPNLLPLYMKKGKVDLYRIGKKPEAFDGNPIDLVLFNESGSYLFDEGGREIRTGTYDNGTKKGKEVVFKQDNEDRQQAYKYSKGYNMEKWNNKTKKNRAGTILTYYTNKGESKVFFKKQ